MNKDSSSTMPLARGWRDRLNMEIVIAVLASMLAIAAIVGSRKFPSTGLSTDIGSGRFPLVYSLFLLVLCGILIFQNLRKTTNADAGDTDCADAPAGQASYLKVFAGIAASVLCLVGLHYLGFVPSCAIYLSFMMWLLGMRHKLFNPLLAIAITAVVYLTFSGALNVPLPTGSLFEQAL